jgi:hypothetical protein
LDGVKLWNASSLKELATPIQVQLLRGPVSCVKWLTGPYDQYETLCFGTALGYLIVWRQEKSGRFVELFATRLGRGEEILDITVDTPMTNFVRFAVGARCGSVQLWKYSSDGQLNALKATKIGETIPRKVSFTAKENIIHVFGLYDGYM